MKRIALYPLLLLLSAFSLSAAAQPARRQSTQTSKYYISIARSEAAQFSKGQWQQTANTLKRGGIPAFFAEHRSLPDQVRGDWLLISIVRRYPTAPLDSLVLGPFSTKQAASAAVSRLPSLISDEGRPLNQNYPGEWSMGNYSMMGERTK